MKRHSYYFWLVVLVATFQVATRGEVFFVDPDAPFPGNGSCWNNAFIDLQDALDVADTGDEVRVAQGIYYPDGGTDDRNISFELPEGVILRGSFAGVEGINPDDSDSTLYPTTLSGDIGLVGEKSDNSYHVVSVAGATVPVRVYDVNIWNGNADGDFPDDSGGGFRASGSIVEVINCDFSYNTANVGGGVALLDNSTGDFTDCSFYRNMASGSGGGLHAVGSALQLIGCDFSRNSSETHGGGLACLATFGVMEECLLSCNTGELAGGGAYFWMGGIDLTDCVFSSNFQLNTFTTGSIGGGGFLANSANPVLQNCIFYNNLCDSEGGAIHVKAGQLIAHNSRFVSNTSSRGGGAVYQGGTLATVQNCAFLNNTSLGHGGAFSCVGNVEATNCVFRGNNARNHGGGIYDVSSDSNVKSSIFWGNEDEAGFGVMSQIGGSGLTSVDYCCIQNLPVDFGGIANFDSNPMFENPDGPDAVQGNMDDSVALVNGSPCIDSGDPEFQPSGEGTDILGQQRVVCEIVDTGACEFQRLKGDATCDWKITIEDFWQWDDCVTGPLGGVLMANCEVFDFDDDEDVDLADFASFSNRLTD